MSTRRARKAANPLAKAPEPIITRTKAAQRKQKLKTKDDKKTEKPELTKPEKKSPKVVKTVKRKQESLLKVPIVEIDEDTQVEYYPNKLKRTVPAKKIILKPNHNFKVVATTNKRKLATPQRGIKSPSSKHISPQNLSKSTRKSKMAAIANSSPELSMQDMVRMMEETRSLSDEDFMEILTCPSPVWWEDPPDGGSDEDYIHTKSPEPPPGKISKANKKRKLISSVDTTSSNSKISNVIILDSDSENQKEVHKITDERFVKKKQKLENILGNIKNKTIQPKTNVKNTNRKSSEANDENTNTELPETDEKNTNRTLSETDSKNKNRKTPETDDKSTNRKELETDDKNTNRKELEADDKNSNRTISETDNRIRKLSESEGDFSDLSFNEEEILKNLEEMEIPIEQPPTESMEVDIKSEIDDIEMEEELMGTHSNELAPKNDNLDREILSIEIKKEIKEDFLLKSPVFHKDSILNTSSEFRSDDGVEDISCDKKSDDIVILDNSTSSSFVNSDDATSVIDLDSSNSDVEKISPKDNSSNDTVPTKTPKDLSKFITVYKITPDQLKNNPEKQKLLENTKTTKLETVKGKLNDFFKQCKSNLRLKKNMENAVPAIPLTDVKEDATDNVKENGDSKIELEDEKNRLNCDYCTEKTDKGITDFSCEKCEITPCNLCNIVSDTKEVDKTHVSSCKDVARISWSHNYVLNQT